MKKLLLSCLFILSSMQLFAQTENAKHEVSLVLLDLDRVVNSRNQKSKFLFATGLIYSYQLSDLFSVQLGISSYETNIEDNCRLCFFDNIAEGEGFYQNKEIRTGLKIEKPSRKLDQLSWLIGGTLRYGRADYRAILERATVTFEPITFEANTEIFLIDTNVTTRYVSTGLDIGFKVYPRDYMFIGFVSNASFLIDFSKDNTVDSQFFNPTSQGIRITANVFELRTGIRF